MVDILYNRLMTDIIDAQEPQNSEVNPPLTPESLMKRSNQSYPKAILVEGDVVLEKWPDGSPKVVECNGVRREYNPPYDNAPRTPCTVEQKAKKDEAMRLANEKRLANLAIDDDSGLY